MLTNAPFNHFQRIFISVNILNKIHGFNIVIENHQNHVIRFADIFHKVPDNATRFVFLCIVA